MANHARKRTLLAAAAFLIAAATLLGAQTTPPAANQPAVKVIDNPAGGRIYLGAIPGQPAPQEALGKTLHRLSIFCGDRPQLRGVVKSQSGDILAAFFTVTARKQDGKPMAGLAIAYAPQSGSAGGAVLMDTADRFPTTVNSMFATLKQQLNQTTPAASQSAKSSASSAPSSAPSSQSTPAAPAQPLVRTAFPDGTGSIALPSTWKVQSAQMGDVTASGPRGERLRFGMPVFITSSGRATGNFIAIPYGTDPATAYKSALTQLARKAGKPAADTQISNVQEIPLQGGKNYFLTGTFDAHDGRGRMFFVAQMINTLPEPMNTWQMTLYQVSGPEQVMAEERATIAAIYPAYNSNSNRINSIANQQIQQSIEQTNAYIHTVNSYTDSGDRMTQGMSDILREQTVVLDTEKNTHSRRDDDWADVMVNSNPNRYEKVPLSDYQRGIDY